MIKSKLKSKMIKSRRALAFLLTNENPPSDTTPKKSSKQQGFTLIELLVVVSILASLAGLASVAMDGYQQESEKSITRVEMQRIVGAIRRFKADTGYWPKTGLYDYREKYKNTSSPANLKNYVKNYYSHSADLSFLFYPPPKWVGGYDLDNLPSSWDSNTSPISTWNIEYAIGWNGPYIDLPAAREIIPGVDCQNFTDSAMTALLDEYSGHPTYMKRRSIGIIDRFERDWRRAASNGNCVTTRDEENYNQYIPDHIAGSPYLYEVFPDPMNTSIPFPSVCTGTTRCIVLRSLGEKNINSDDIYFVLVDE